MDDTLLYDWDDLFHGPGFPRKALGFFRAVGHTITTFPLVIADDVLHCIYSELSFNAYFGKTERSAFECISSLSHLFNMDDTAFERIRNAKIQFYSIDLSISKSERTATADIIISAFAKSTSDYIVLLFRHENSCMISFARNENSLVIFHSDWFTRQMIPEIVDRADISNLSLKNSTVFFYDLVHMMARSYYTHPISKDYAFSLWHEQNPASDLDDETLDFKNTEYIKALQLEHISRYGNDYVCIPQNDTDQADTDSDSDLNFDLLELELDEMIANGMFAEDETEFQNDEDFDEVDRVDIDSIPPEILNDPVELLKWLEKQDAASNSNDNEYHETDG